MKLTNPTDEELNAAFAEKVAGLIPPFESVKEWQEGPTDDGSGYDGFIDVLRDANGNMVQSFTRSAGAVLPWLEKWPLTDAQLCPEAGYKWVVSILEKGGMSESSRYFRATGETLSFAAVIALLRAHGVEVEFTNGPMTCP